MAQSNLPSSDETGFQLPTELAYAELLPEIEAVAQDDIAQLNVDVLAAVSTVIAALPALRALRGEIVATFRIFDLDRFDKLEKYAQALSHANTLHRSTLPNKASIAELGADLALLRDQLYSDAMALARHRLVDGVRLKDCRKNNGYQATAGDILAIVAVFKDEWAQIQNKTPVTLASLNDAGSRAIELVTAAALREQAPLDAIEAARTRLKAYTLFFKAYEDARRAVRYLRPDKNDAESIAPSLFIVRTGRKRDSENEPAMPPKDDDEAPGSGPTPTIAMDNSAGLPVTHPFANP